MPVTQQDLQYLDIAKLRRGEPISVILKADLGGGSFWEALVTRTSGVFDPQSRVLYLVAEVLDPYDTRERGRYLWMGTFVSAEISGGPGGELFKIPRHSMPRGSTIWLVDEESRIYLGRFRSFAEITNLFMSRKELRVVINTVLLYRSTFWHEGALLWIKLRVSPRKKYRA